MADPKLEIILSARDMSAKAFQAVQGHVTKLDKAVSMLGIGVGGIAGGAGIAMLTAEIGKTIAAASDLEETASKFNVVFAGQIGTAEQWTKTLVDGYAMSTREAKQYLGAMQDLLVPMGMNKKAAAEMSNEVVKLAADLGSFNNQNTATVMGDIQSALVGNYETMKKYGVVLSAATVEQEALKRNLADTKNELTAADKAAAAYGIIVRSSASAIGDMERTSDSYANATKKLNAAWEDLSATIGQKFIEAAAKAKLSTADLLAELNKMIVGPGLDAKIAQTQARIDAILAEQAKTQEQREAELDAKRRKREERHAAEVDAFVKKNTAAVNSLSQKVLDAQKKLQDEQFKLPPEEVELKQLRQYLDYLNDIKRFQDGQKHQETKEGLAGFDMPIEDIKKASTITERWLDESRQLNRLVRGIESEWNSMLKSSSDWAEDARKLNILETKLLKPDTMNIDLEEYFGELDKAEAKYREQGKKMIEISQHTAEQMQAAFSDFFFDAMQGKLKDLGDYIDAFLKAVQRTIAEMLSQELVSNGGGWMSALGKWLGGLGSGGGEYIDSWQPRSAVSPGIAAARGGGMGNVNVVVNGARGSADVKSSMQGNDLTVIIDLVESKIDDSVNYGKIGKSIERRTGTVRQGY